MKKKQRFWTIDFARGTAIIMMIVFHFFWNLEFFGIIDINLYDGFFGILQKTTASLFLLVSGTSLFFGYKKHSKNFALHSLKKSAKIFSAALLVTIGTFLFFPQQFIFFGILHLIATATLIVIPFTGKKNTSLLLAIAFLFIPFFFDLQKISILWLLWLGFSKPVQTLDFFPVFPWIAPVFFGVFLGQTFFEKIKNADKKIPVDKASQVVIFLGKNSLLVYLAHQPILFVLTFLYAISFYDFTS